MRNPPWTREEVILALDLYASVGCAVADHPKVIALSGVLRTRPGIGSIGGEPSYRNPNGVSLKLANFASLDPAYPGTGMKSCSQLDRAVWTEFSKSPNELRVVALRIRREWS